MSDKNDKDKQPFEMPPPESKNPLEHFTWILSTLSDEKLQQIANDSEKGLQSIAALNILNSRKKK